MDGAGPARAPTPPAPHDAEKATAIAEAVKKATDALLEQMGKQRGEAEAQQEIAEVEEAKASTAAAAPKGRVRCRKNAGFSAAGSQTTTTAEQWCAGWTARFL